MSVVPSSHTRRGRNPLDVAQRGRLEVLNLGHHKAFRTTRPTPYYTQQKNYRVTNWIYPFDLNFKKENIVEEKQ